MDLRCDSCGSTNLVWDNKSGTVICGDCGLVLERIYFNQKHYYESDQILVNYPQVLEVSSVKRDSERKFNSLLKKSRNIRNIKQLRIYVEPKEEGLSVGHIISKESLEALATITSDGKMLKTYTYMEKEGWFSGLRLKTRVALTAFLVFRSNRRKLNIILKILGIDEKYLRKLLKRVPKHVRTSATM